MKTTLDLPDALVLQVKQHALNKGTKLRDTVVTLLQQGLRSEKAKPTSKQRVSLPLIVCKKRAELTPEIVAETLLKQDSEWHS